MKVPKKYVIISSLLLATLCPSTFHATTNVNSSITKSSFNIMWNCGDIDIEKQINIDELLAKDLSIKKNNKEPKILIIHSHPQESYSIDEKGTKGSVNDVGDELEKILEANYNVSVLHLEGDNNSELLGAYDRIETRVQKVIKEYPSIEVIIDIHRDGGVQPTTTIIEKQPTAMINMNNGLCLDTEIGTIGSLKDYINPYIKDNLSLSMQIKSRSDKVNPDLIKPITLSKFRYSLHMLPKSLLIDVGNNMDTVKAAKNAMEPFSEILADVLRLEGIENR